MQAEIIKLKEGDNLRSIVTKINACSSQKIIIEMPSNGHITVSTIDLIIFLRSARKKLSRLAFVTKEFSIIKKAEMMGIPVFQDINSALSEPWRRKRSSFIRKTISSSHHTRLSRSEFEMLRQKKLNHRKQDTIFNLKNLINYSMQRRLNRIKKTQPEEKWWRIPLFLVSMFGLLYLIWILIPSAHVNLWMSEEVQSIKLDINADAHITSTTLTGGIPIKKHHVIIQVEDRTASSASMLVEDGKSSGIVEFTNLTDQAVEIPVGTVVLALNESIIRYKTLEQSIIPAGIDEKVEVSVEAIEAGSHGNVDIGEINAFEGSEGLYLNVSNPIAMSGGTEIKSLYPNESDYQKLKKNILKQIEEKAIGQFEAALSDEDIMLPHSTKMESILDEIRIPEANKPADFLTLSIRAEYIGLSYNINDVRLLATSVMDANLDIGMSVIDGSLEINNLTEPQVEGESAYWIIFATRKARQIWESEKIYQLAGLTRVEAVDFLETQYHFRRYPEIVISPRLYKRMPYFPSRITVDIQ